MVTDINSGTTITGAVISLGNSSGSEIGNVETTSDGLYFIQLAPGDYTLLAIKEGFSKITKM